MSRRGRLCLVASGSGSDGAIAVRQDVNLYASVLAPGQPLELELALPVDRHLWVQVLRGGLDVNGKSLAQADGLAASQETKFRFSGGETGAEFLAFDLA